VRLTIAEKKLKIISSVNVKVSKYIAVRKTSTLVRYQICRGFNFDMCSFQEDAKFLEPVSDIITKRVFVIYRDCQHIVSSRRATGLRHGETFMLPLHKRKKMRKLVQFPVLTGSLKF